MKPVKKIALLHDLCGVGKASMINMIPVLGMMGIEACPIPTVILSTHTGGYGTPAVEKISGDYIRRCADHYLDQDVAFDMIFVGYLGSADIADAVRYFIRCFPGTDVVMDPIMGDHGEYYRNFDSSYGQAVRELLPCADLIVPNLTEACILLNADYRNPDTPLEAERLCRRFQDEGAKDIVITSVPVGDSEKGIAVCEGADFHYLHNQKIADEFHGTGDVFDGVLAAALLNGHDLTESVQRAHRFVCDCICESIRYDYPRREGLMIEKTLYKLHK